MKKSIQFPWKFFILAETLIVLLPTVQEGFSFNWIINQLLPVFLIQTWLFTPFKKYHKE